MGTGSGRDGRRGRRRWRSAVLAALLAGPGMLLAGATPSAAATSPGYWLLGRDGGVFSFGLAFHGSAATADQPCEATSHSGACYSIAATADGGGYWILAADTGRIYNFGDAVSYGQPADTEVFQAPADFWPRAVQIVPTRDGKGYWVLEHGLSDLGSVQAFGDAHTFGDEVTTASSVPHSGSPVALVGTADDGGYWIVDSDGGVFSFGDARFYGSMGGTSLQAVVVDAAATPDHHGYWLAAADGGVFSFGDAVFGGSLASVKLAGPIEGIAANPAGPGYWLTAVDGGVFAMGGAPFLGSMGSQPLEQPVVAMTAATPPVP